MRRGRAQRQRSDQDADHEAHVVLGPRRRELHPDRVDTGHAGPRHDPQRRSGKRSGIDGQQKRVGERAGAGGNGEKPARIDAIGQAEKGARQTADDEARLNAAGERRLGELG